MLSPPQDGTDVPEYVVSDGTQDSTTTTQAPEGTEPNCAHVKFISDSQGQGQGFTAKLTIGRLLCVFLIRVVILEHVQWAPRKETL